MNSSYIIRVWFFTILLGGIGVFFWGLLDDWESAMYMAFFATFFSGISSIPTILVFTMLHKALLKTNLEVIMHKLILAAATSLGICMTLWVMDLLFIFLVVPVIYIMASTTAIFLCEFEKNEQAIARVSRSEEDIPLDEL